MIGFLAYLIGSFLVLLFAAGCLAAGFTRPHLLKRLFGHRPSKKLVLQWFVPLVLLSVISVGYALLLINQKQAKPAVSSQTVQIKNGKTTKTVVLPAYEKVADTTTNDVRRVTFWVDSSDETKINLVNDKVYSDFTSAKLKTLYINYFNDKTVAKTYYDKAQDPKLSTAGKKELTKHFIGSFIVVGAIRQFVSPAKNLQAANPAILGTKK